MQMQTEVGRSELQSYVIANFAWNPSQLFTLEAAAASATTVVTDWWQLVSVVDPCDWSF
jgi:hypothetical protein